MRKRILLTLIIASLLTVFFVPRTFAEAKKDSNKKGEEKEDKKDITKEDSKKDDHWITAVKPKPLSNNVLRGLSWLVERQQKNGGWGQGEESSHMGNSMESIKDIPNVGDTCAATLALIRSGSTPKEGKYASNILEGIKYVCKEIEQAEEETLFITKLRNTRLQMKLGTYIDTFLASILLAEVKGKMPDEVNENMVFKALDKVMDKIEKNQKSDGTFGGQGWANALSLSMASKGINRAAQAGMEVNEEVRSKLETNARKKFDKKAGKFDSSGSAGVDLYAGASNLSSMQDSDNTNKQRKDKLKENLKKAKTKEEREQITQTLDRYDQNEKDMQAAQGAIIKKLDDKNFIAGFGSNGGEEFLSYMNIGESLVVKGGDDWNKWDKDITANLNRIQNNDGSWTGHHCITGRTFCTSAALLVLMTDRAPVPLASRIKK